MAGDFGLGPVLVKRQHSVDPGGRILSLVVPRRHRGFERIPVYDIREFSILDGAQFASWLRQRAGSGKPLGLAWGGVPEADNIVAELVTRDRRVALLCGDKALLRDMVEAFEFWKIIGRG